MRSMSHKQNILIIGGGNAGISVAKALSEALPASRFEVTIITERNYHIHYPALLRMLVSDEGNFQSTALNPYDRLFKAGRPGRIIVGKVSRLIDGLATLEDGREFPYDWLVLASGMKWEGALAFPPNIHSAAQWIHSWRKRFEASQNIVLIGGGAVGVELAGELRHVYPNKNITVVHASEELFNEAYPMKFRKHAHEALKRIGIKVLLGDRLGLPSAPQYDSVVTLGNVKLSADLVVPTRGGQPNTTFLRSFDQTILNYVGRVKVLPTFRVPLANGKENVFACGDIIDWNEQKALSKVPHHISVVVANLLATIDEEPVEEFYQGCMELISIPLGPNNGFTFFPCLGGIIIGPWATKRLKSRHLFVHLSRKLLGYA